MERALGKVEDAIEAHLVLWTAAEQLAITQAFEKVSKAKVVYCTVAIGQICYGLSVSVRIFITTFE